MYAWWCMAHGSRLTAHGQERGAGAPAGPGNWGRDSGKKLMFLRFCKVRCRDNLTGIHPIIIPHHSHLQNPINITPGPLLCKVSWIFGFSVFAKFFQFVGPYWPLARKSWALVSEHDFVKFQIFRFSILEIFVLGKYFGRICWWDIEE